MTVKSRLLSVAGAACAAAMIFTLASCKPEDDPRYMGWNKYSDKADGFAILVPPGWEAENELMLNMRGTRLYDTTLNNPSLALHVYFSIYVKDLAEDEPPQEEHAQELIDILMENFWSDLDSPHSTGELDGRRAYIFELEGNSIYDGIPLRAVAVVAAAEGKDFVILASATADEFPRLRETYEMMIASFSLPE